MVEQLSLSLRVTGNWDYSGFTDGNRADDRRVYPSFAIPVSYTHLTLPTKA